jgi:hypothetical protein
MPRPSIGKAAPGLASDGDQLLAIQIRGRAGALQRSGFVRFARVQGRRVVLGVNGDGRDAELFRSARDTDRDFAAVGDEQLVEGHTGRCAFYPKPGAGSIAPARERESAGILAGINRRS